MAREFGTSQAPVREALRDLEALGVVEITAFRGARVRRPSARRAARGLRGPRRARDAGGRLALAHASPTRTSTSSMATSTQMRRAAEAGDTVRRGDGRRRLPRPRHATCPATPPSSGSGGTLEPFSRTYITIASPGVDRRPIADRHAPLVSTRSAPATRTPCARPSTTTSSGARQSLARVWADPDAGSAAPPGPIARCPLGVRSLALPGAPRHRKETHGPTTAPDRGVLRGSRPPARRRARRRAARARARRPELPRLPARRRAHLAAGDAGRPGHRLAPGRREGRPLRRARRDLHRVVAGRPDPEGHRGRARAAHGGRRAAPVPQRRRPLPRQDLPVPGRRVQPRQEHGPHRGGRPRRPPGRLGDDRHRRGRPRRHGLRGRRSS